MFALSVPLALLIVTLWPEAWQTSLYLPLILLALTGADAAMALPASVLSCRLHAPGRLHVGQDASVRVTLEARGFARPVLMQALLDQSGDTDPPRPASGLLENGRLDLTLSVMPRRRGLVILDSLWLRWSGPLRLTEIRRKQAIGESMEVTPDTHGIHEQALRFFARDAAYGIKTQRLKGEGAEFDTLSEYLPGMDSRFIDWKRSARHRKLLVKEFRQERNHQIVLGFDTGHLMVEPVNGVPKLDHAIAAGLLLGRVSLHYGDMVGACGFDARFRAYLKPGRNMPYFTRLQSFSASLDYHNEESNFTLGLAELNARLQRRALVVLFTEFVDSVSAELLLESLRHVSRRHLVVFVTLRDPLLDAMRDQPPRTFSQAAHALIADDFLRERAIVLERIARMGIHCLNLSAGSMPAALLNRYLLIKQRGLL